MIKRWKRRAKLLATSIIIAGYVTIGLYNAAILRGEKSKKMQGEAATAADSATVKTIVGYSMEFRMREESMTEDIRCDDAGPAPVHVDRSQWKRDDNLQLYAYSAYYDSRLEPYHYVRVIGLLPRNVTLYCQIWHGKHEKGNVVFRKATVHEIWSKNWGRNDNDSCDRTYPSLVSCPVPAQERFRDRLPERVSFVDGSCNRVNLTVEINYADTADESFVVCVKALNYTNHTNDASLAEWIELNARFGAGKIIVYVSHLDETDLKILSHYEEKRIVHIRSFEPLAVPSCPARNYEEHLWQKRKMEVIAYNDCFYRNIDGAKFVIPLDIDEIIVPKIGNNWYEAFRSHFGGVTEPEVGNWPKALDEYSSFSVRNVYFFAKYPEEAILRNLMLPGGEENVSERKKLVNALKRQQNLGPRDSIFKRNVRSSSFSPESDSAKSFVHVPKTLSVFNHYAFHVLGEASRQYIFPENVVQLNHYRSYCDPLLIDGCHNFLSRLTVDDSLQRFRNQILFVKH